MSGPLRKSLSAKVGHIVAIKKTERIRQNPQLRQLVIFHVFLWLSTSATGACGSNFFVAQHVTNKTKSGIGRDIDRHNDLQGEPRAWS